MFRKNLNLIAVCIAPFSKTSRSNPEKSCVNTSKTADRKLCRGNNLQTSFLRQSECWATVVAWLNLMSQLMQTKSTTWFKRDVIINLERKWIKTWEMQPIILCLPIFNMAWLNSDTRFTNSQNVQNGIWKETLKLEVNSKNYWMSWCWCVITYCCFHQEPASLKYYSWDIIVDWHGCLLWKECLTSTKQYFHSLTILLCVMTDNNLTTLDHKRTDTPTHNLATCGQYTTPNLPHHTWSQQHITHTYTHTHLTPASSHLITRSLTLPHTNRNMRTTHNTSASSHLLIVVTHLTTSHDTHLNDNINTHTSQHTIIHLAILVHLITIAHTSQHHVTHLHRAHTSWQHVTDTDT